MIDKIDTFTGYASLVYMYLGYSQHISIKDGDCSVLLPKSYVYYLLVVKYTYCYASHMSMLTVILWFDIQFLLTFIVSVNLDDKGV